MKDYICANCGEYIGDIYGLEECPMCGYIFRIEDREDF